MSKYWGKTFQETMGKTVTGLSDSALRLKQGWNDKPQISPEPSSQSSSPRHTLAVHTSPQQDSQKQQFLRLNVESAKKLRWYDREDLNDLVKSTYKDKQLLQMTISALRQHIQDSGASEETLDASLKDRIEEAKELEAHDEGVASVLLVSLQDEVERLHAELKSRDNDIQSYERRIADHEEASSRAMPAQHIAESLEADLPVVLNITIREEAATSRGASADVAERLNGKASTFERRDGDDKAERDGHSASAEMEASDHSPDGQEGAMEALIGKLRRVEEERRDYFEEMARLNDLLRSHETEAAASKARIASLEEQLTHAQQSLTDVQQSAARKIQELRQKVEESKSQHTEMLKRAQDICIEADDRAGAMEKRSEKAEARASKAEAELVDLRSDAKKASNDLKVKDKEIAKLEARATSADGLLAEAKQKGEVEKGGALSSALAAARKASDERESELRKAMREGEAKLKDRVERLETDNASLRRSLAKAEAELQVLEARILEAEEVEASLHRELRVAENATADRDGLEAANRALKERLEETRAEQGQLANYKQIAKELEASRTRTEEEIIATVRIATSLEARLHAANSGKAAAEHAASLAEKRCVEAERRIEREVARKLEVISADEMQWPAAAKESLARLSRKLEAMHDVMARLQTELDSEQHNLALEQAAKQSLQSKLSAAEEKLGRIQREARESTHRLEQRISTLQAEITEWQMELSAAEAEVSRLTSVNHKGTSNLLRPQSSGPKNRGDGSLSFANEGKMNDKASPLDHLYLKNVLLKFVVAATQGHIEQCNVLLPAVATLLHANAQEFSAMREALQAQGAWWSQKP